MLTTLRSEAAAPLAGVAVDELRRLLWPLLAMALLWTIIPAVVHTAPPLDVVEGAMWGREWVVGTYKHPAMPAWFIEAGRWLDGGHIGWPVYATAQVFNLATLALTFVFARDLAGSRVASAAVLALLGVEYFSWRSFEFNHTQAQMPFWVGAAVCAWRAVERGTLGWWLALGATAALGLYAKLSNAMELIVIAGWILSIPRGRRSLGTLGPWAGAVTFIVLSIPLTRWLLASNFQALTYASERGQDQSLLATILFPANAVLQAAPVMLTLAWAGILKRGAATAATPPTHTPETTRYLLVISALPPLLLVGMALAEGSGVRATWMAPAIPLLTVLLLHRFAAHLSGVALARLGAVALGIAVLVPLGYAIAVPAVTRYSTGSPLRVGWPQGEIAQKLARAWAAETGKPLRIVAGSSWSAGLVGIDHPDRPSILTEGNLAYAPWITPARLARDGALVVWFEGRGAIAMPALERLAAGRTTHDVRVAFPDGASEHGVVIKYAIVPPAAD